MRAINILGGAWMFAFLLTIQFSAQATFVSLASPQQSQPTRSKPLARGIRDVKARIAQNQQIAGELKEAMTEHLQKMGEMIYSTYGQEKDPGRLVMELNKALDDTLNAVKNGKTGQVWPAVGQLGQALMDCASDMTCAATRMPPLAEYVQDSKPLNLMQQEFWEFGRLGTTIMDYGGYEDIIGRDTQILQNLEAEDACINTRNALEAGSSSSELGSDTLDEPVMPVRPYGVDLSSLDDAMLIARWL